MEDNLILISFTLAWSGKGACFRVHESRFDIVPTLQEAHQREGQLSEVRCAQTKFRCGTCEYPWASDVGCFGALCCNDRLCFNEPISVYGNLKVMSPRWRQWINTGLSFKWLQNQNVSCTMGWWRPCPAHNTFTVRSTSYSTAEVSTRWVRCNHQLPRSTCLVQLAS